MQDNTTTISRRSVATGLAWSVPAVAAVTAAPFAAASPINCPDVEAKSEAVKFSGNSAGGDLKQGYGFEIKVTNDTAKTVEISAASATVEFKKFGSRSGRVSFWTANPCEGGTRIAAGDDRLTLEPGESIDLFYVVSNTGNSANESGCIHGKVGVAFLKPEPGEQEACGTVVVPTVCFTETPPTC